MVDVAKYLYTPESELTDQLKFSIIKNRVPARADQMPNKIYKDKRKKSGESKRYCSYDWFHTFKFIVHSKSEACFQCQLIKVVGLKF